MEKFWDPARATQVAANGLIVPGTGDVYNGLVMPGTGFPNEARGRIPEADDSEVTRLFRGIPRAFHLLRKANFQPRLSLPGMSSATGAWRSEGAPEFFTA